MGKSELINTVTLNISGEDYEIEIYLNGEGHLEFHGLPTVTYELWGNELLLSKYEGE